MRLLFLIILISLINTCLSAKEDPRVARAFREDKAGWIYVHLEGSPGEIGFQHGYLLAPEIDDAIRALRYYLKVGTKKEWSFYRNSARRLFWPKLDKEYQDEISGIVKGLLARGRRYDKYDITALNGWMELAQYYLPSLRAKFKPGADVNKSPGNCSAFIATGSYTSDGKIVMGHNAWVDYIVGERWNVIADIVPLKGYRILMDTFPGFIHSGDDFAENSAGILITETTIAQFHGFNPNGIPEFERARKAEQYASNIDDFIKIMIDKNNGGYANDWLAGDIKTNEIARLELGLKHYRVWRTRDGYFAGANFPSDSLVIKDETTFRLDNPNSSMNARKLRWNELIESFKGKIDAEVAKQFESDHFDVTRKKDFPGSCSLCGHVEDDHRGIIQWGWKPYFPGGAVQGKVTTSKLAEHLQMWARMGHPCGESFIAAKFFRAHPQYKWMARYLHDMPSHEWVVFGKRK
ncbi:MAG: C45 family autoproteolytic acyltransferase/hydrolase [Candidatus Kryptoniota bacterium]